MVFILGKRNEKFRNATGCKMDVLNLTTSFFYKR
jgi:hypothetical protein